jgi:general secretion pathway protein M
VLALAILLAAIGLTYLVVALPLHDLYVERKAVMETRSMMASRLALAARELPALRGRLAELRTTASASKVTLDGSSDAIASANLQSHVETLATPLGVTMGSIEALAADDRGGFRRIGLRVAVNGEYEGLVRFLGAIEASVPPLVLGELHIRSTMRPAAAPGYAKLDAGFEIYGFRSNDKPVSALQ